MDPFLDELAEQRVLVKEIPSLDDLAALRNKVVEAKRLFLKESAGTEKLQSVFELVDTEYRDRIENTEFPHPCQLNSRMDAMRCVSIAITPIRQEKTAW